MINNMDKKGLILEGLKDNRKSVINEAEEIYMTALRLAIKISDSFRPMGIIVFFDTRKKDTVDSYYMNFTLQSKTNKFGPREIIINKFNEFITKGLKSLKVDLDFSAPVLQGEGIYDGKRELKIGFKIYPKKNNVEDNDIYKNITW